MNGRTKRLVLLLVSLGPWGCVSQAPLENSPCPCPTGYACCGDRCLLANESCSPGPSGTGGQGGGNGGQGIDAGQGVDAGQGDGGQGGGTGGQGGGTGGQGGGTVTSPIVSIGIGSAHACAVRADGTISCRGSNDKGQATPPPGLFSQVVAGGEHTCAQTVDHYDYTKDGLWVCWGDNTYGQATAPPAARFNYVAAGGRHTCGAGNAGVVCWGDDTFGQSTPPAGGISADARIDTLAAGRNHTCALVASPDPAMPTTFTSSVLCWGDDSRGQATPPAEAQLDPYFLAAGGDHTCSSKFTDGPVRCWGDNDHGQSTSPPGLIRSISVASGHSCGMPFGGFRNTEILCWGSDWGDALPAPPDGPFDWVVAGDYLNCGLPSDHTQPVVCWGQSYEPWF